MDLKKKIIAKLVASYLIIGVLTVVHWNVIWLRGIDSPPPWDHTTVTIVFGPVIAATWPWYWVTMFQLGAWAWT